MNSKNKREPLSDINKLRSAIKNMLFLAVTLESTNKLVKTRDSDKQDLTNYVIGKLGE